jgi:hypothetical protein
MMHGQRNVKLMQTVWLELAVPYYKVIQTKTELSGIS